LKNKKQFNYQIMATSCTFC